ncbi:MAG TPA: hypothetical protein VHV83_14235, partial [Armatimonadota bacterium]|nr:hypothetical protein [Armatimonadota bacterium]
MHILRCCLGVMLVLTLLPAWGGENLLLNADFTQPANGDGINGWRFSPQHGKITVKQDGKQAYLSVVSTTATDWVAATQIVKLQPAWKFLQLSGRIRVNAVTPGKAGWETTRISTAWRDKTNAVMNPYPVCPSWYKPTDGWVWFAYTIAIPDGAVTLEVSPTVGGCVGDADFADLRVSTTENLLCNGDFTRVDASGHTVAWNYTGTPSGAAVMTDGAQAVLSLVNNDTATWVSLRQAVPLNRAAQVVEVSGRVRVSKATPGKADWHTTRLALSWTDAKGSIVTPYPRSFEWRAPTNGWVNFSEILDIPDTVTQMVVEPAIFNSVGQVDFADLSVKPLGDRNTPRDGVVPPDRRITWGQEPVETVSTTRARICLNGLWQFLPVPSGVRQETPPPLGWGYMPVPGAWSCSGSANWDEMPKIVAPGWGPVWKGLDMNPRSAAWNAINSAWYQRPISIPANWTGRDILVNFSRVCTDAQVYVNGKDCGRISWPGGAVDISKAVRPGETATLSVMVISALDGTVEKVFMGPTAGQVYTATAEMVTRGIVDDVFLESQPHGAIVSDVFVQPSTRKKNVTLTVELQGITHAGPVTLTARCCNERGVAEQTFTKVVSATAQPTQTITVSWPWAHPRLWDVDQPNLYTFQLLVHGDGIHDEYAQSFGFREFWIDGKKFFLNGKEIRWRPTVLQNEWDRGFGIIESINGTIDAMHWAGFNIQEFWPWNHYQRGTPSFHDLWYTCADRKGWPVIGALGSMANIATQWNEHPAERTRWETYVTQELRRERNHPSVLMWVHSPNRFGNWQDQNPRLLGDVKQLA